MLGFVVCSLISLHALPACQKQTKQESIEEKVVQNAHLAGSWYSADKKILNDELDQYFTQAQQDFAVAVSSENVKALVVPHAGYFYSGLCAATVYQTLLEKGNGHIESRKNKNIKRVVILAPSHRVFLHGITLPTYTHYQTALGEIAVDQEAVKKLRKDKSQLFRPKVDVYGQEHSLEMQLPMLQKTIDEFEIVPLIVGHLHDADYAQAQQALKKIINDQTLVCVTSDFVHHGKSYDYDLFSEHILDNVRIIDSALIQAIQAQSFAHFHELVFQTHATVCGREPLKVLLALLETKDLGEVDAHLTSYYTSAHVKRERDQGLESEMIFEQVPDLHADNSVSYAGIVFAEKEADRSPAQESLAAILTDYEKKTLAKLARKTLENEFVDKKRAVRDQLLAPIKSKGLTQVAGAFVTLNKKDGSLRGCIGNIVGRMPLYQTVIEMTRAAAFNDTRFERVQESELSSIKLDVTVLSVPKRVESYQDIVIGKHGVYLKRLDEQGNVITSSVFLPQVPVNFGWDRKSTLEHLAQKAGLEKDGWQQDCIFEVFEGFEIWE